MVIFKDCKKPEKDTECQFYLLGWCTANKKRAGQQECAKAYCPLIYVDDKMLADLIGCLEQGLDFMIERSRI